MVKRILKPKIEKNSTVISCTPYRNQLVVRASCTDMSYYTDNVAYKVEPLSTCTAYCMSFATISLCLLTTETSTVSVLTVPKTIYTDSSTFTIVLAPYTFKDVIDTPLVPAVPRKYIPSTLSVEYVVFPIETSTQKPVVVYTSNNPQKDCGDVGFVTTLANGVLTCPSYLTPYGMYKYFGDHCIVQGGTVTIGGNVYTDYQHIAYYTMDYSKFPGIIPYYLVIGGELQPIPPEYSGYKPGVYIYGKNKQPIALIENVNFEKDSPQFSFLFPPVGSGGVFLDFAVNMNGTRYDFRAGWISAGVNQTYKVPAVNSIFHSFSSNSDAFPIINYGQGLLVNKPFRFTFTFWYDPSSNLLNVGYTKRYIGAILTQAKIPFDIDIPENSVALYRIVGYGNLVLYDIAITLQKNIKGGSEYSHLSMHPLKYTTIHNYVKITKDYIVKQPNFTSVYSDGYGDYIYATPDPIVQPKDEVSIIALIKPEKLEEGIIASKGAIHVVADEPHDCFKVTIIDTNNNTITLMTPPGTFSDNLNKWTWLGVSYDKVNLKIFLNDKEYSVSAPQNAGSIFPTNYPWTIGEINGKIGYVTINKKAITLDDFKKLIKGSRF